MQGCLGIARLQQDGERICFLRLRLVCDTTMSAGRPPSLWREGHTKTERELQVVESRLSRRRDRRPKVQRAQRIQNRNIRLFEVLEGVPTQVVSPVRRQHAQKTLALLVELQAVEISGRSSKREGLGLATYCLSFEPSSLALLCFRCMQRQVMLRRASSLPQGPPRGSFFGRQNGHWEGTLAARSFRGGAPARKNRRIGEGSL